MGNTDCGEFKYYSNGGLEGPTGCVGDQLWPRAAKSYDMSVKGVKCSFYMDEECQGNALSAGAKDCTAIVPGGPAARGTWKSFKCVV